jgi:phosphoribosylformylglycinamidine cyclo-ligase
MKNMPFGYSEVKGTRGESAYVFKMGSLWGAFVQEGLGTKSLVAQSVYQDTGKSFFANIAQDTVACIVNDLISVGATPVVLNAYWSSSSYGWLADRKLAEDFIKGWRKACDMAKVTWGGGETQSLKGIVQQGVLEFAGSAFGVINSKEHLIQGKNLRAGDAIVLVEASGVHANGISLIREIAAHLADGYRTKLADDSLFGETVLTPTPIYTNFIHDLFRAGLNIHYLSNITGHGWRKLMRATGEFTYSIELVPPVPEIFNFISEQASNDEKEMYSNYNMGAGYAVYLPPRDADRAVTIAKQNNLKAWVTGRVEKGPKQVQILPKGITYHSKDLEVHS